MSKVFITSLFCTAVFSGCGVFVDRSDEYKHSGSIQPLKLPSEVTHAVELGQLYEIPELPPRPLDAFELDETVPRPTAMSHDREQGRVEIQRVAELSWILLEAPASQLWPLAQSFFAS